jgi:predicted outer membrane repeat protein
MNPLIQLRRALYLVALMAICTVPFALAQRNAPKQRVANFGSATKRLVGAGNAPASIIVVTDANDSGPGSLRNALTVANDGDTIDATGVSGTILLTSGELQITRNVTINGPGAKNLAVNGNAISRVFENFASNVTISGFTVTNGLPLLPDSNGGGGILNHGGLTLTGSRIISNNAGGVPPFGSNGGGINSNGGGTLTVTNSVISGNNSGGSQGWGGGLLFSGGGTLTVTNSVIINNSSGSGGGIYADGGIVTVSNSTISGNMGVCNEGGGIATNNAQLTVMNSTISGNVANNGGAFCGAGAHGGGIACFGSGTLTVTNSTISGNLAEAFGSSADGGGIFNGGINGSATLRVTNSTLSGNSAPTGGGIFNGNAAQIGDTILNAVVNDGETIVNTGTVTSLGYNLASDDGGGVLTGPGDQINTDPMLGPLQDNGGPTFTHALLPGSPAIDAGNPNFTPPPSHDQRGCPFSRVFNSRIDIGSFEAQPPSRPCPTPRPRPTPAPRP